MTHEQEHPMLATRSHTPSSASRVQRGLSLIVVLLSLVTLAFASVALIRSIDTGSLVMGNLSFKKTATTASDRAADAAIDWLESKLGADLYANDPTNGYIARRLDGLDVTGNNPNSELSQIDWDGDGKCAGSTCYAPKVINPTDADPLKYRYLITRMCSCVGSPNSKCPGTTVDNVCSYPMNTSAGTSPKKGELKYGDNVRFGGSGSPYFRIVVRTEGPRDTATVTETYVHF